LLFFFQAKVKMERDVVFVDSPFSRYLAENNLEPPPDSVFSSLGQSEKVATCSKRKGFSTWLFRYSRALALSVCNIAYRTVTGNTDVLLEEDFADIKSALREEIPELTIPWFVSVLFLCGGVISVAWSWLFGLFFFGLGFVAGVVVWRRRNIEGHVSSIVAMHEGFVALEKQLKKSLNVIREVELVSRGFRIGATVQSPVSLVELSQSGSQNERHLAQLRNVCAETARRLFSCAKALLDDIGTLPWPTLSFDVQQLRLMLTEVARIDDQTIKGLSTTVRLVHLLGAGICVVMLRCLLLTSDLSASRQVQVVTLACIEEAGRLSDARLVDWRKKATHHSNSDMPLVPALGALQAGLRTIGARSVLFADLLRGGKAEDAEQEGVAISAELSSLASEWDFRRQAAEQRKVSADVEYVVPPVRNVETVLVGGLEVEVIGEGQQVSKAPCSAEELNDLLKVYEIRSRSEEEVCRVPILSREERIREMYERKAAEERQQSEARAVYALIDELENVLKKRRADDEMMK
jgi:hypothetical protein